MRSKIPLLLLIISLSLSLQSVRAEEKAAETSSQSTSVAPHDTRKRLRVGIKVVEPFVFDNTTHFSGYSIDIWEKIAQRLHLDYEYVVEQTTPDLVKGVQNHSVDIAIGGTLAMTAEREKLVDFTHPYYNCGLQILVRPKASRSLLELLDLESVSSFIPLIGIALLCGFIQSHVIYFAERGSNPRFQTGYFKGVWEGFWAMWMIIATGEYLEKDTPHPGKRAVTIMFWLLGALFVATFTATITSNLTLRYLTSNINGPNELAGKRVVTVRESAAAKYLVNHRIGFVPCPNIEECYKQLLSSQADAVVFDAPVLQYFSWHEGNGKTLMVGPIFDHVPFGMALPFGSPLRKRINEAILQLFQDGTSEEINKKWFGSHIPEEEQSGFLAKQR